MPARLPRRARQALALSLALAAAALAPGAARAQQKPIDTLLTIEKYLDFEQVADPQISPDGSQIVYTRRWVNRVEDRWDAALWIMNADGTRNRFLTKGGMARWSPDGTRIAYVAQGEPSGAQLFVRWMDAEGATSQVTRIAEGPGDIRWAPDGKSIGFTSFVPKETGWRIDMPAAPPGAHWTSAPKVVDRLHYRQDRKGFDRAGDTHLFVVPADGGTPRQLTSGDWSVGAPFDGQAGGAAWSWTPDGKTIVVEAFDDPKAADLNYRDANILAVDVATGATKRLTTQPGTWTSPVVSPDGKRIAYTGYARTRASYQAADLYVMNVDGGGATRISGTLDRDPGALIWAPDGGGVYFTAEDHGTVNVWYAPATGGQPRQVTTGAQVLSLVSLARSGAVGAGVRTSPLEPPDVVRLDLRKGGGKGADAGTLAFTQLTHVNDDLLQRVKLGAVEHVAYRSGDGTDVDGWLVKPPGYVAGKKYPLIMEIHGGPHGMYNVGFSFMYQNFAASNYLVLYTNPRGSTGYGSRFGNAIERDYPGVDYQDLMAGVNAVIAQGIVDTTRMYVGGCSGGGVLSSWVIGHTTRFAAAAVRCPVIDWLSFAGHTDIPLFTYNFFDRPFWEDPKPWLDHSSLMYVGHVTTPTMLMTGELDMRTPMPQSEEFFAALKMRGVPARLLRFEGEYHGTGSKPSNFMRTQLYMLSWYGQWPAPGGATMAGEARK